MSGICNAYASTHHDTVRNTTTSAPMIMANATTDEACCSKQPYYESVPVLITVCTVAAAINVQVLVSVYWLGLRQRSPTLTFTISLTAADAYVALIMALGFVVNNVMLSSNSRDKLPGGTCMLLVLEGIRAGAMITSVLHLLVLAINHYYGVLRPLSYTASMTPFITKLAIVVSWIGPPATLLIYFGIVPGQAFRSTGCANVRFYFFSPFRRTLSSFIFAPLLLMLIIYGHIFVHIRVRRGQTLLVPRHLRAPASSSKAIITTCLILGTFTCGWVPAFLRFALVCCDCPIPPMNPEDSTLLGIFVNLLILLKCLIDPIIYATRMKEIRAGLQLMHVFCFCRKMHNGMTRRQAVQVKLNSAQLKSLCGPSTMGGRIPQCGRSFRTGSLPVNSRRDTCSTTSSQSTDTSQSKPSTLKPRPRTTERRCSSRYSPGRISKNRTARHSLCIEMLAHELLVTKSASRKPSKVLITRPEIHEHPDADVSRNRNKSEQLTARVDNSSEGKNSCPGGTRLRLYPCGDSRSWPQRMARLDKLANVGHSRISQ